MPCSGETTPAFIAQGHAELGRIVQIPRYGASVDCQGSAAGVLLYSVVADSKVERIFASVAEIQSLQRKSMNEALRLAARRKPDGPHMNGQPSRVSLEP